jgi:uncharacterized membrane protein YphA (DoxX/SURF4 family)
MKTILFTLQIILASIFLYSGMNKSLLDEKTLVKRGQTGVEGLSKRLIKFIGISEILGAIGILCPTLLNIFQFIVPFAAICLGIIMVLAARIHFKRNEKSVVFLNLMILLASSFIAYLTFNEL